MCRRPSALSMAPQDVRRLIDAIAEEREARFGNYHDTDGDARYNDDQWGHVRNDMTEQDAHVRGTCGLRDLDVRLRDYVHGRRTEHARRDETDQDTENHAD